jgi:hypothetical protein
MPVDRSGIFESVNHLDLHRLPTRQYNRRSNETWFTWGAWGLRIVQLERIPGRAAAFADLEPQLAVRVPRGKGFGPCTSRHCDAQHELSHAGCFLHVRVLVSFRDREADRGIGHLRDCGWNHVLEHVAVKEPVSRSRRRPAHVESLTLRDPLRHHERTRFTGIVLNSALAIKGVNSVIEAMQMQRMRFVGCVDPTPTHQLLNFVFKPLRVGPGFAVDRRQRLPRTKTGTL